MFDSFHSPAFSSIVLKQIERIQHDFLELAGPHVPKGMADIVANVMGEAATIYDPEAMKFFEHLHLTKYQNPIYQNEIALASGFVIDSFQQYEPPEGVHLDAKILELTPFSTVNAPALTGFVYEMDVLGEGQSKLPSIFISQHCMQTAWICGFVRNLVVEMATEEAWKRSIGSDKVEFEINPKVEKLIALETSSAFFCDWHSSRAGHYFESSPENIEAGRILISFLLAHECSHVCLVHRPRRNDANPIALSSFRLRDLTTITEQLTQTLRLEVPIRPNNLKFFFGHQQDELDADLMAFLVIYKRIRSVDRCEELLPVFFRQVCYSILWCEIDEVFGRNCKNGAEWSSNLMHNPQLCTLSDIAWRERYPSAYSRIGYLYDRAKLALDEKHLKAFELELREAELLFGIWRNALLKTAHIFASVFDDDDAETKPYRDSFVWKGMPQSMRGSIGYNDPTKSYHVYDWENYLRDA